MNKFEKLGLFLARLLVVWLMLMAIKELVDFLIVQIPLGARPFRWALLIDPVLLTVAAFALDARSRDIARYLGKDLGD